MRPAPVTQSRRTRRPKRVETRVIPLDKRPHVADDMGKYLGEAPWTCSMPLRQVDARSRTDGFALEALARLLAPESDHRLDS